MEAFNCQGRNQFARFEGIDGVGAAQSKCEVLRVGTKYSCRDIDLVKSVLDAWNGTTMLALKESRSMRGRRAVGGGSTLGEVLVRHVVRLGWTRRIHTPKSPTGAPLSQPM